MQLKIKPKEKRIGKFKGIKLSLGLTRLCSNSAKREARYCFRFSKIKKVMKKNVHFVFLSLVSIWVFAYPPIKKTIRLEMEKGQVSCCSDTLSDGKYDKRKVITEFANTLNMLKPNRGNDKKGFYLDQKCQLVGAFIWDISDTLNNETILNDSSCI